MATASPYMHSSLRLVKTVWESGGADSVRTAALLSRSCQVSVKKQKNKIKIDSEIVNNLPAKELINEFSALKAFFGISCATWIKTPSDKELKTKFETFLLLVALKQEQE